MYRYPIGILQKKLDGIYDIHPQTNTLNEYRAPNSIIINEDKGLKKARKIVTPHRKISELFFQKSILLNWSINIEKNITLEKGLKVLFPGSSLARKGAYEVRRIVQELELPLVIKKGAMETKSFWNNINIEYADSKDIFQDIGLIIYPAYIDHSPRIILQAMAKGIPVIISDACGIESAENVTVIPSGNYDKFKQEIEKFIKKRSQ
ncbi:glycosyltransferase [Apibacter muscae]|uniref:glycosyltransferase n=1 Tax=Apibacter muscae TaxID=2509004 RepID=UPI0011AD53EB|nr:glycosyltransferase [Apibacter muscae]TWP23837.1 glycosyltransferase [Apibacter muscae]